ncbi:MAG: dual specificity protein phosphatase family protein [Rhabdochlamydiaceae bacterium]
MDGLNPPKDIQVVVNLDPARIELESEEGIEVYQFPIVDADAEQMGMGANEVERLFKQAVFQVIGSLQKGRSVLVHCMEGKNRTGMVVATVCAYLLKQNVNTAFGTFMDLRGRSLSANPTPTYWSFARNTLDEMNNIDIAMEKLRAFVQTSPHRSALDEGEIQKRLGQDPDLLNAILFPYSDEAFRDACARLIGNSAT